MGFLKKMKAKLEDFNGFLKENISKIRGFPPIRGRMASMNIEAMHHSFVFYHSCSPKKVEASFKGR